MIDLAANHLGFVFAAYGIAGVVLAALVISAFVKAKKLKRELVAKGLSDPGSLDKKQ